MTLSQSFPSKALSVDTLSSSMKGLRVKKNKKDKRMRRSWEFCSVVECLLLKQKHFPRFSPQIWNKKRK